MRPWENYTAQRACSWVFSAAAVKFSCKRRWRKGKRCWWKGKVGEDARFHFRELPKSLCHPPQLSWASAVTVPHGQTATTCYRTIISQLVTAFPFSCSAAACEGFPSGSWVDTGTSSSWFSHWVAGPAPCWTTPSESPAVLHVFLDFLLRKGAKSSPTLNYWPGKLLLFCSWFGLLVWLTCHCLC